MPTFLHRGVLTTMPPDGVSPALLNTRDLSDLLQVTVRELHPGHDVEGVLASLADVLDYAARCNGAERGRFFLTDLVTLQQMLGVISRRLAAQQERLYPTTPEELV